MSKSSNILPARFDNGDFECWLRKFDACSDANGWKVAEDRDDKFLKLPAFLRGKAASHFYAIPAAKRTTYKDAVAELRKSLCPAAQRARHFSLSSKSVLYVLARIQLSTSGNSSRCWIKPTLTCRAMRRPH